MSIEKIHALIQEEVRIQINKYARVISKRHDISLKLLLQDLEGILTETEGSDVPKTGQCLGLTAKGTQCKSSGKNQGYCVRHKDQKKEIIKVPSVTTLVGTISLKESMEKDREKQRTQIPLMIQI
jgi:hypothetical protein